MVLNNINLNVMYLINLFPFRLFLLFMNQIDKQSSYFTSQEVLFYLPNEIIITEITK